jgi:hypothetical protein
MNKHLAAFMISAAIAAYAGGASAAELCQQPGPPPDQSLRPVAPVKPPTPSCVNEETRVANCKVSVLKAYNAGIDGYNAALRKFNVDANAYIDALNHWARSAGDYGNCEVQELNREVAR